MEKKNVSSRLSQYFIYIIFVALVIVLTILKPSFIQPGNLVNILKQASINGIHGRIRRHSRGASGPW